MVVLQEGCAEALAWRETTSGCLPALHNHSAHLRIEMLLIRPSGDDVGLLGEWPLGWWTPPHTMPCSTLRSAPLSYVSGDLSVILRNGATRRENGGVPVSPALIDEDWICLLVLNPWILAVSAQKTQVIAQRNTSLSRPHNGLEIALTKTCNQPKKKPIKNNNAELQAHRRAEAVLPGPWVLLRTWKIFVCSCHPLIFSLYVFAHVCILHMSLWLLWFLLAKVLFLSLDTFGSFCFIQSLSRVVNFVQSIELSPTCLLARIKKMLSCSSPSSSAPT